MKVGNRYHGATGVYVGRPSPLGNPFRVGPDGNRSTVIEKYRVWLDEQIIMRNERVISALRALSDDDTLVCVCAPKPCHADVIAATWKRMCKLV